MTQRNPLKAEKKPKMHPTDISGHLSVARLCDQDYVLNILVQ